MRKEGESQGGLEFGTGAPGRTEVVIYSARDDGRGRLKEA